MPNPSFGSVHRLRLGRERHSEEAEGAREESSPLHYWITSSARASTAGGIVSRGPWRS